MVGHRDRFMLLRSSTQAAQPRLVFLSRETNVMHVATIPTRKYPQESPRFEENLWISQVDTTLHRGSSSSGRGVWEPSQTTPLEYPTPAVRRGVARFHEQVRDSGFSPKIAGP